MSALVATYLQYCSQDLGDGLPSEEPPNIMPAPVPMPMPGLLLCNIELIGMFSILHAYLTKQLSVVYDVYLEILHSIDSQLKKVMGQDTANWWLLNACPLVSIDGNNSLKRWNLMVYGTTPWLDT
ncbi:hypothetical protein F5J12DRAFT_784977 [Pisolithus orientalis]|uniref:uncharacterized protein n=1 Tax=Pisolithus orientalis TaxID=936130 RepID=UPI0022241CF8|nr:uncharacterized protein F5J12DRAFT_784977 [Pisolithus orientalis]KAI5998402.1 hypothetical protein F5J12DRAFT_784977 [Pisolithus orientalis]